MKINQLTALTSADNQMIDAILAAYNKKQGVGDFAETKNLFFKAEQAGQTLGYARGYARHGWARLYDLVVTESGRGNGVGAALLTQFEAAAKACGCVGVQLTTASFQAPKFYEKHGYEQFALLEPYSGKHQSLFFKKVF